MINKAEKYKGEDKKRRVNFNLFIQLGTSWLKKRCRQRNPQYREIFERIQKQVVITWYWRNRERSRCIKEHDSWRPHNNRFTKTKIINWECQKCINEDRKSYVLGLRIWIWGFTS